MEGSEGSNAFGRFASKPGIAISVEKGEVVSRTEKFEGGRAQGVDYALDVGGISHRKSHSEKEAKDIQTRRARGQARPQVTAKPTAIEARARRCSSRRRAMSGDSFVIRVSFG